MRHGIRETSHTLPTHPDSHPRTRPSAVPAAVASHGNLEKWANQGVLLLNAGMHLLFVCACGWVGTAAHRG